MRDRTKKVRNEDELVEYIGRIMKQTNFPLIKRYWHIGRAMQHIRESLSADIYDSLVPKYNITEQTLNHIRRFAQTFLRGDLEQLLNGNFIPLWDQIKVGMILNHNSKFLDVFDKSDNLEQYLNGNFYPPWDLIQDDMELNVYIILDVFNKSANLKQYNENLIKDMNSQKQKLSLLRSRLLRYKQNMFLKKGIRL
jgi:hypothetical protein